MVNSEQILEGNFFSFEKSKRHFFQSTIVKEKEKIIFFSFYLAKNINIGFLFDYDLVKNVFLTFGLQSLSYTPKKCSSNFWS
jgi:hypothetical protein